jgi:hypothetical protein
VSEGEFLMRGRLPASRSEIHAKIDAIAEKVLMVGMAIAWVILLALTIYILTIS